MSSRVFVRFKTEQSVFYVIYLYLSEAATSDRNAAYRSAQRMPSTVLGLARPHSLIVAFTLRESKQRPWLSAGRPPLVGVPLVRKNNLLLLLMSNCDDRLPCPSGQLSTTLRGM
jgi:hypothetical protein